MTISTTTTRVAYNGDGASSVFTVPFPFFAVIELEVLERSLATGTETPRQLGTDYTVAGGDGATGTVTAASAPASGTQWVIRRNTARLQTTDYTPNDPFPAETHERALDRLTLIDQELGEELGRALKFPATDAQDISPVLPGSVARAGRVLAFDPTTGDPVASNLTLTEIEAQPAQAAASAAAALASRNAAAGSATTAGTSAAAATAAQAAAEAAAAGMKWRPSVRAATTVNITLSGAQTIDGVAVVAGDRVLVKDQTTASQNGVYVAAAGAWSRATDADTWAELVSQCVGVEVGAANADYTFICTVDQGGTLGTTAVTWNTFKIVLGANAVANAALAQMPAGTLKGNATGSTANATDLTIAQVRGLLTFPYFSAYVSANQSLTSGVATKIQFNAEEFDSNGWYDNATNYRFTPQLAGKYRVTVNYIAVGSSITIVALDLYRNGSPFKESSTILPNAVQQDTHLSTIVHLNGTTDYIEAFGAITGTAPAIAGGSGPVYSWFSAEYIGP